MRPLLYAAGGIVLGSILGLAGDKNYAVWMAAAVVIVAVTTRKD